jgi:hypothetical protein
MAGTNMGGSASGGGGCDLAVVGYIPELVIQLLQVSKNSVQFIFRYFGEAPDRCRLDDALVQGWARVSFRLPAPPAPVMVAHSTARSFSRANRTHSA